ncbi:Vmc-like lipoprotein signal peptide domain-containing protein [Mycoplasmopsis meleagridis]|uniref:Vmc-like lipoprotein signal peptide domain-containing protein n=1 Tax=Mycoplasmopsis meleagridis TaxID=29561 RepID=UPI003A8BCDA1
MRIKKIFYKSGALALITAISPIALIATACNNDKKTNVQYSEADIQQAQENLINLKIHIIQLSKKKQKNMLKPKQQWIICLLQMIMKQLLKKQHKIN